VDKLDSCCAKNPTGSIEEWNKEFPEMPVFVREVVREVNGVEGSAAEVQKMLVDDPDTEIPATTTTMSHQLTTSTNKNGARLY